MSEKPSAATAAEAEQAQAYLDYYWRKIGADEVLPQITKSWHETMADVTLLAQLEPLDLPKTPESDRDRLVEFFQINNWLPRSHQEAVIAGLKGVDETIYRAEHARQGNPQKALVATYRTIRGFWYESAEDVKVLNRGLEPSEDFGIEVDIHKLRANQDILYLMGDYMLYREFLDQGNWPNKSWNRYIEEQKYWRGFMLAAARYANDDNLKSVYEKFLTMARNRLHYWTEKSRQADQELAHVVVKEEFAEKPGTDSPMPKPHNPSAPVEESGSGLAVPDSAKRELNKKAAEFSDKAKKIETMVQQGFPRHLAELRELGGKAIYFEGKIVGVEEKDRTQKHSANYHHRTHKTRRGLGPTQLGIADNDKKAETERWLRGE